MATVKICGITNLETARTVLAQGTDMLGFHIELNHGRNPVAPERAAEIISQLPESCTPVLVTSIIDPGKIIELAKKTGVRAVQFHGDALEMRKIKSELPQLKLFKVVSVFDKSAVEEAKQFEGVANALVLDSAIRENGQKGGTGKTHDWNISRKIVESISLPVILAGGLNPENVAEAIQTVRPYGVDVNSGVSNSDGTKDLEKVKLFVGRAKES
jgi:phosphoribosylanthranilate isomerase